MRIAIILCTYNGALYLEDQLDSLVAQQFTDWVCYAFDDCSTDGTQRILDDYARSYPQRFIVTVNRTESGSAAKNFMAATEYVARTHKFELLCYCDQDDIWVKDKLANLEMQFQGENGDTPLLVFSDLCVVGEHMEPLYPSFVARMSVSGQADHVRRGFMLVDNIIPGCALICNRALVDKAIPFSRHAIMHDWWLALIALKTGEIRYIPEKLVSYRQHSNNAIGAHRLSILQKLRRVPHAFYKLIKIFRMLEDVYPNHSHVSVLVKYIYVHAYKFIKYN